MFGKRVVFYPTGDKPTLIQCGRCHMLGHNLNSRHCKVPKNAFRCARCGGQHHTDDHDFECKALHSTGGRCDCPAKCILCGRTGHTARSRECPKRGDFRPPTLATPRYDQAANATAMGQAAPVPAVTTEPARVDTSPGPDGDITAPAARLSRGQKARLKAKAKRAEVNDAVVGAPKTTTNEQPTNEQPRVRPRLLPKEAALNRPNETDDERMQREAMALTAARQGQKGPAPYANTNPAGPAGQTDITPRNV